MAKVEGSRIVVYGMGEKLAAGETLRERKVEFVFYEEKGEPVREVVRASGVLDPDYDRKRRPTEPIRSGRCSDSGRRQVVRQPGMVGHAPTVDLFGGPRHG